MNPRLRPLPEEPAVEIQHLEDLGLDLSRALTLLGVGDREHRTEGRAQFPPGMGALEFLGLELRDASTRIHDGLLAIAVAIRERG
jgi:hypothetical protein